MTEKRVLTNKNYAWFYAPAGSVEDIRAITETEAAAFINITDAMKLDGTNFNTKASKSEDDRSFADAAGAKTAGNGDFGGTLNGFKAPAGDTTSSYHAAEAGIKPDGSDIILLARPVESAAPDLAAGDEYDAWHILSDAASDVRGNSSYAWAVDALPQSDMAVRGIIAPAVAAKVTATIAAGAASGAVGSIGKIKAVYQGKIITIGAKYTSSDPTRVTVSEHGIFERIATGEADIIVSFPGATPSDPLAITVT
ncbi:phage tail tube protein [Pseudolysinimonas sp.]|uniref:phage tail tube protein n=1 Tax=Pseudolysinimonas sp. TaxID=2680009 RepID=UPI003F81F7EE